MRAENLTTDSRCQEILHDWENGELTERQARQGLAAVLSSSGVSSEVSRELGTYHAGMSQIQLRQDVTEEFDALLYTKITKEGPEAFFNLSVASSSSVTGWARQTLRSARRSVIRNLANRTIAHQILLPPVDSAEQTPATLSATVDKQAFTGGMDTVEDSYDDPVLQRILAEEAEDWMQAKASSQRGSVRSAAGAAAMLFAFSLPALVRPDVSTRDRLATLLAADERAAYRSVKAMLAAVTRAEGYQQMMDDCDPDLLSLWDDYSRDHLFDLVNRTTEVAHVLAANAVADKPRPNRTALRKFRLGVRRLGPEIRKGRKAPGWTTCAESVCRAYVAEEYEAFSPFDTTGASTHGEKQAGRDLALATAWDDYERAIRFPGAPLGATHDDVRAVLAGIMDSHQAGAELAA